MGGFPNSKLTAILFPPEGINYTNQFLEKNKWLGTKEKMGSWQIYGFSHWHLALPYWLKGLNNFPP